MGNLGRRSIMKLAGMAAFGFPNAQAALPGSVSLFDGRTLDGWLQIENSATTLSSAGITDPAAFIGKLLSGQDGMSVSLRSKLTDSLKADLASYSASDPNAKTVLASL